MLQVRDRVIYTNPQGVVFELMVWKIVDDEVYLFHDCFWRGHSLKKVEAEGRIEKRDLSKQLPKLCEPLDEYRLWQYKKLIELQPTRIQDIDWFILERNDKCLRQ